jgi:hypothetical protein
VRVRDARGGAGLAGEAGDDLLVGGERRVQDFDRDGLLHQDVRAAVDRAHPALADALFDAVLVGERAPDQCVLRPREHRAV